jgi:lipoprotein-anchoring transpeptidase ErfK/SrfK
MPRPSLLTTVVVLVVAIVGALAVASSQRTREQRTSSNTGAAPQVAPETRAAVARATPKLEPITPTERAAIPPKPVIKPAPKPPVEFPVARVRAGRTVALHSKPGGRVLASVGSTTEFGSPTTLAVAARRGRWLGVTSTDLPNGKLGWVEQSGRVLQAHRTPISIRIDLSKRSMELHRGRRVLRRASVGIGRPGSTTPTGRFSVTDKLQNTYGPFYGSCIVALSGHQTNTPAGWRGGDRLAIHGTDDPGSIGQPSSAGCLHADAEDMKALMRRVPLGTPVFIRQ